MGGGTSGSSNWVAMGNVMQVDMTWGKSPLSRTGAPSIGEGCGTIVSALHQDVGYPVIISVDQVAIINIGNTGSGHLHQTQSLSVIRPVSPAHTKACPCHVPSIISSVGRGVPHPIFSPFFRKRLCQQTCLPETESKSGGLNPVVAFWRTSGNNMSRSTRCVPPVFRAPRLTLG